MDTTYQPRSWMKPLLIGAGIYNLLWALIAVVMPQAMLDWLGVETTAVSEHFWQCIGMIVGVYGVGYLIAARSPYRHWPMTLVGLLGKVFGPIGFAVGVAGGTLPASLGWTIITNDLIWWIPFAMILWGAVRYHQTRSSAYDMSEADDPIRELSTNDGRRLDDLADRQPQLVVFLRHTGCAFCREALADISRQRTQIEGAGCGIVLVHLGKDDSDQIFARYQMHDVPRINDPSLRLYRQFGLDLGGFSELFGLRVWVRVLMAGLLHGRGPIRGNSFQMPGVYLYYCGQILGGFRHDHASDRPDYFALAQQVQANQQTVVA
ncbi:MAG: redoxin domain-containing protein [Fuerstiella sp.]|nr:redoxin domain-containing protein [Fuerstiella sp.]